MLSRSEAKQLRALGRRRGREREGRFVAEGVRVVEELLASGLTPALAVISPSLGDTRRGAELAGRLRSITDVREVTDAELGELSDTATPQGVLVVAGIPMATLAELEPKGVSVLLVLDGVQDPGNLGTLARSAAAFGCEALACLPGTVDPWNPKSVRGGAGALFRMPVVRPAAAELEEWLGRHGYLVAGADAAGESVGAAELPERVALVVGNEGSGLEGDSRARCERLLAVPMKAGTESLNVAVAGGILLYELMKDRA